LIIFCVLFIIRGEGAVGMVWACWVLDDVTLVAA